jgi:alkylation response protein AidB-like acyl-CoA dehydrogenase
MRLTTEQIDLVDLIRRFFAEHVSSDYLKQRVNSGQRSDRTLREALRALGLYELFAGIPSQCGLMELALVAEECGRFLVTDATVESVLAGSLLESLLSPEDRPLFSKLVAPASGACAVAYPRCCRFITNVQTQTVSGAADWAVGAEDAQLVLGFTSTESGQRAFIARLDSKSENRELSALDLTTPIRAIRLDQAESSVLSRDSTTSLGLAIDVLKAAEISGVCKRAIEMTTKYAKSRYQFGAPIGSFQAIQQKLAAVYAETEALSSLTQFAAWSFSNSPEQRQLTSRAAILKAAQLGPLVCETAIQCHGGIGFTWEYELHLFLRRALTVKSAFGIDEAAADNLIAAVEEAD